MGTRFEIVIAADDEHAARPLAELALREVTGLHQQLNRFAPDSLLSHINRTAAHAAVRLDCGLYALLETAQQVGAQSGGAFDVTLGSGAFLLDRATHSIRFAHAGVALDLGGIAKGYALDRAGAILRDHGVTSALLHGGTSSVLAIGAAPGRAAWRIEVAHTRACCIDLNDAALSVSRPCSQLGSGHLHIIDARTGAPVGARHIAVVSGPSATVAEAWSTAAAVLGERPAACPADYTTNIELEHDAE